MAGEAVVPMVAGSTYSFTVGDITFAGDGPSGYVTGLTFGGTNLLTSSALNDIAYGSSFWTSPQTWDWPPAIDDATYTHMVDAATNSVVFVSADVPIGDNTISVEKRFWGDSERNAVVTEYTVNNTGAGALSFAPWQITRVANDGLVFYPQGDNMPAGQTGPYSPPPISTVTVADGMVWYDFTGTDAEGKSVSDGAEGWLAYVANGVLFLKSFPDNPAASQAPGEGEVEVYVAPDETYIELEPQGALSDVAAGAASDPWRVTWYVRAVPAEIDVSVGSAALVDWVRTVAAP